MPKRKTKKPKLLPCPKCGTQPDTAHIESVYGYPSAELICKAYTLDEWNEHAKPKKAETIYWRMREFPECIWRKRKGNDHLEKYIGGGEWRVTSLDVTLDDIKNLDDCRLIERFTPGKGGIK